MPDTPRQRRTAASIVEGIKARYENELETLQRAKDEVDASTTRLEIMTSILNDAEKNGEAE